MLNADVAILLVWRHWTTRVSPFVQCSMRGGKLMIFCSEVCNITSVQQFATGLFQQERERGLGTPTAAIWSTARKWRSFSDGLLNTGIRLWCLTAHWRSQHAFRQCKYLYYILILGSKKSYFPQAILFLKTRTVSDFPLIAEQ